MALPDGIPAGWRCRTHRPLVPSLRPSPLRRAGAGGAEHHCPPPNIKPYLRSCAPRRADVIQRRSGRATPATGEGPASDTSSRRSRRLPRPGIRRRPVGRRAAGRRTARRLQGFQLRSRDQPAPHSMLYGHPALFSDSRWTIAAAPARTPASPGMAGRAWARCCAGASGERAVG